MKYTILAVLALMPFAALTSSAEDAQQKQQTPQEQQSAAVAVKPETTDQQKVEQAANAKPDAMPKESPEEAAKKAAQREIQLLQLQKAKIDSELALAQSMLNQELAPESDKRIRTEVANAVRQAKTAANLAEMDETKRILDATLAIDSARDNIAMFDKNSKLRESDLDSKIERMKTEIKLAKYNLELTRARLRQEATSVTSDSPKYMKDPVENGTLYISDRRIEFNGPVTDELAKYVVDRINFYNNQNTEYPIFIVIDNSPGGSAFAGYQIMKAMESSRAPVCVVLKNFCASMAAIVTTTAKHSYCYANSMILHHQASSGTRGNMTQMTEELEATKAWTTRLFSPVCKKIGKTQEEFVKDMYAHFSTGDWIATGTEAQKMKWVDTVVDKIVETGIVKKPVAGTDRVFTISMNADITEKTDERGNTYFELPALRNGDAWLIYDPQNRYRAR